MYESVRLDFIAELFSSAAGRQPACHHCCQIANLPNIRMNWNGQQSAFLKFSSSGPHTNSSMYAAVRVSTVLRLGIVYRENDSAASTSRLLACLLAIHSEHVAPLVSAVGGLS